ncbi:MAG: Rab family GTPase [Promethearchaeota archaeon]
MNQKESIYVFKTLLLGDGAVGKTSLISQFTKGFIKKDYKMTIGVDIFSKTVNTDEGTVKLSVWDLAGQERFKAVRSAFFGGTAGALLVFDLTRIVTFRNLVGWLEELYKYGSPNAPVVLIGNKVDLPHLREVRREDAEWFAQEIGSEYIETSAKTGEHVEEAFNTLTTEMVHNSIEKAVRLEHRTEGTRRYTTIDRDRFTREDRERKKDEEIW